jgi:hypothetical protein
LDEKVFTHLLTIDIKFELFIKKEICYLCSLMNGKKLYCPMCSKICLNSTKSLDCFIEKLKNLSVDAVLPDSVACVACCSSIHLKCLTKMLINRYNSEDLFWDFFTTDDNSTMDPKHKDQSSGQDFANIVDSFKHLYKDYLKEYKCDACLLKESTMGNPELIYLKKKD